MLARRILPSPPLKPPQRNAHFDQASGKRSFRQSFRQALLSVDQRRYPRQGTVTDGSWLACAIACQWVSDLTYVRNSVGRGCPGDLMEYFMENFDLDASNIELVAMWPEEFERKKRDHAYVTGVHEPKVPLRSMGWNEFDSVEPFDVICLARSPDYTPAESDPLFDEIRDRFVNEEPFR